MKHLILAAALLGATATTTLAQGTFPPPPTAAESQAGKQSLIAKTNDLDNSVKNHNTANAQAAATEIMRMMKTRVAQTRYMAEATTGAQKDALMKRVLLLESRVISFRDSAKDINKNGQDLVSQARAYTNDY
jgi:uncharacterized protein YdcH (DUF465 family)